MRRSRPRHVPTVTQVAQTECGLCCCVALLRYHGRAEGISSARAAMDAGRDGLSATQLVRFLQQRGMAAKIYRAKSITALKKFTSPVILYWEDYHFVVLEKLDGKRAIIMDPSVGRRRLTHQELAEGFSGIVIAAEPTDAFERLRAKPFAEWRSVSLFAEGSGKKIILVALLSLAGYGAALGIPMLTKWVVDTYAEWQGFEHLAVMLTVVFSIAAGYFLLQLIRIAMLSGLVALLSDHLMTQTFARLLSLPYRFFTVRQPGELLFRLNSVNAVSNLLSSRVAQGVLDIGTLTCVTVYLFVLEWRLGLIALGLVLLNAAYLVKTRPRVVEIVDAELSQLSKSQSMQLDAIVSIPAIKMGGYAQAFLDSWSKTYKAALDATKKRMRFQQGHIAGVSTTTQMFGPIVLLLAGLYFVSRGQITLGSAIAVQSVSATYFALVTSAFQTFTEFAETSRYVARLSDITTTAPESPGGSLTRLSDTSIRLENVGFQYTRHSPLVLRDVSMEIEAGAKIALVGASGSGKSTLGRIVCGLYEPTSGRVLFGGRDMREYQRSALRQLIGYVPQEVHLHNRTILENLTLGQDIPEEKVREYCESVGILDFLDELPMGLKTLVSEMGANFSGGQRQRLAIVRALLRRPKILVMDEATASLDTINERRVSQIIQDIGATQLIIAHRLATIQSADRIYVLDQGRLVEQGTHAELLRGGSVYSNLYAEISGETVVLGGAR